MASPALAPSETAIGRFTRLALHTFPIWLFILAFLPRLVAVNRYITPDELIWVYRSVVFREAFADGRWADTIVAGHPGVTTTWLGSLATTVTMALAPETREDYAWLTRLAALTPDNTAAFDRLEVFLDPARAAVAAVNALGVVAVYLLARRLWGVPIAAFAALLLALDPFTAGLAGLFHVDGLSATFGTLSLLALGLALRPDSAGRARAGWLVAGGLLAAAAGLTKSPLLLLGPLSAAALVVEAVVRPGPARTRAGQLVVGGAVWGLAFAGALLLYPAVWPAPLGAGPLVVARSLSSNAGRHIEEALRATFFMGRVAFDHGPLFYPVALFWRASPVVIVAVVPAVRGLVAAVRQRSLADNNPPRGRHATLLLAVWVVAFILAITPAAKKFDRYLLPVIPALLLLAAIALVPWLTATRRRWALPVLVGVQALFLLAHAGYPLAAYNPLAGGPLTAARVMPVGWGEGISAGGRWLAENRPDAPDAAALAGVAPSLAPYYPGRTLVDGIDDPAAADYIIQTLTGRQLAQVEGLAEEVPGELLTTIRFGGLEQAWVYGQEPQAPADALVPPLPSPVAFGDPLALEAASLGHGGETVRVLAEWRRLRPLSEDERFRVRLVLRDLAGNDWATVDTELLDAVAFHPPDWTSDRSGPVRYALETPPAIPPGDYDVLASVVDERTAGQLPATSNGQFLGVATTLGTVTIPPAAEPDAVTRLQIPIVDDRPWLSGDLRLLGRSRLPAEALAGSDLPIDLFWHATAPLPAGLQVAWRLTAEGGDTIDLGVAPLSRFDTGQWRSGETIQEKYRLSLPPTLPPGDYTLSLAPLGAGGEPLGDGVPAGSLRINNIDRLYTLPDDPPAVMDVAFGDVARLRGSRLEPVVVASGKATELTLIWQAAAEPDRVYTVFVHMLDPSDTIVAQFDHWPGGLPSDIWAEGQVIIDRTPIVPPAGLPPGDYRIAVGLYDAVEGQRLAASGESGDGLIVEPDRVILPDRLVVTPP